MTTNGTATVIVDGLRTPFGKLGGGLSSVSAVDLAHPIIKKLVEANSIESESVDEVIIGQVVQAAVARFLPGRR